MSVEVGPHHTSSFGSDPKHLGFMLRRYHFVARMLHGANVVLDAVYALDVLEHIPPEREDWALVNMREHLKLFGKCIIGMPSRESQPYASLLSRQHHVNCKTEDELRAVLTRIGLKS